MIYCQTYSREGRMTVATNGEVGLAFSMREAFDVARHIAVMQGCDDRAEFELAYPLICAVIAE